MSFKSSTTPTLNSNDHHEAYFAKKVPLQNATITMELISKK